MDQGKILINLSKGKIGDLNTVTRIDYGFKNSDGCYSRADM